MLDDHPCLAIFDLDNTLLEGDCEDRWGKFLFQKGLVDWTFIDKMYMYYQLYDEGKLDIHEYQSVFLKPLTEIPLPKLFSLRAEYLHYIKWSVRIKVMHRVNRFRAKGFVLLMITSCNEFLAEPIARLLNFSNLICTQIRMADGKYTTTLLGIPPIRNGKLERLTCWLEDNQLDLSGSWGYSDSHNDIPLLKAVDNPVAVFPDRILRSYAEESGWKIINT